MADWKWCTPPILTWLHRFGTWKSADFESKMWPSKFCCLKVDERSAPDPGFNLVVNFHYLPLLDMRIPASFRGAFNKMPSCMSAPGSGGCHRGPAPVCAHRQAAPHCPSSQPVREVKKQEIDGNFGCKFFFVAVLKWNDMFFDIPKIGWNIKKYVNNTQPPPKKKKLYGI